MEEVIENIAKGVKAIKSNIPEVINNIPEILKKKHNLPKEIEALKKEMRELNKAGRQIVAKIKKYEESNVSKEDEEYKATLIDGSKLARKVLVLKAKISQKESLLENINLTLEVIQHREFNNLEKLKKEMRALKKEGVQIVAEMNEYEKNNISKEDEKYKEKLIEGSKLARKVLVSSAKISQKESLLKEINSSLEVKEHGEDDNLKVEYQSALENIYQKEKQKAEKEEEERKEREEIESKPEDTKKEGIIEKAGKRIKNIRKKVPEFFSNIKNRFKGIKSKTQSYSETQRMDLEEKEETVPNDTIVESGKTEANSVIEENNNTQMKELSQEVKVDNSEGQIEKNAQKSVKEKMNSAEWSDEIIDMDK